MGAIGDMQKYLQYKAARAMGDAAQAGGGEGGGNLAGAGVGLGAGMGVGAGMAGMISQAMAGAMQQPAAPAARAAAAPDVMTVAEAAAYLKVGEADVLSLISGGDLKAKKIGSDYRIAKKALDDYLAA